MNLQKNSLSLLYIYFYPNTWAKCNEFGFWCFTMLKHIRKWYWAYSKNR